MKLRNLVLIAMGTLALGASTVVRADSSYTDSKNGQKYVATTLSRTDVFNYSSTKHAMVPVAGKKFEKNSKWATDVKRTNSQGSYFRVSTNEWLNSKAVNVPNFLKPKTQPNPSTNLHDAILNELNSLRTQNGLQPVKINKELNDFTQQRANTLANQGYLSHKGYWDDVNGTDRFYTTEDIQDMIKQSTNAQTAIKSIAGFYDDRGNPNFGHRKSLLDPFMEQVGIGVQQNKKWSKHVYIAITMAFPTEKLWDVNIDDWNDYSHYISAPGLSSNYPTHYNHAGESI